MSDEQCQLASMVSSTGQPPEMRSFLVLDLDYEGHDQQEVWNNSRSLSAVKPSHSTVSLETDTADFSPWTFKFPDIIASTLTSTQETKPRIVIEEGSYFHYDLHKLVECSKILTRMKEIQLGKDSEKP